jgi:hypothetical protein
MLTNSKRAYLQAAEWDPVATSQWFEIATASFHTRHTRIRRQRRHSKAEDASSNPSLRSSSCPRRLMVGIWDKTTDRKR